MSSQRQSKGPEPIDDVDGIQTPDSDFDSRATGRLSALNIDDHRKAVDDVARQRRNNWRIAIGYLIASVAWILLTDTAVEVFIDSSQLQARAQTIKGIIFVSLSAAFIFFLVNRHFGRIRDVEKKLQERDTHIGHIIDTMANGVALIDLDGTIVDVNPALAEMLGQKRSELIGRSLAPVRSSSGDRTTPTSSILQYARHNGQWSGELVRRHADGHQIPIHLTLAPLYDDDGELTGYVGDYLDLRAIKKARAHLHGLGSIIEQLATETDLEIVGDKAVDAAIELTDSDLGGVVLLNEDSNFYHHWHHGFDDEPDVAPIDTPELVARLVDETRPRIFDDFDSAPARLSPYADANSLAAVPLSVRENTCGALIVAAIDDDTDYDDHQLELLEAIARQIGVAIHRHELLEEARRSEARFRNVVNTVPDILYKATLPEFETQFMSPSVESIIGTPPNEFTADPTLWRKLIHEDDIDEVTEAIEELMDDSAQQRYSVEYRCWNRERTRFFWFEDRGRIERDDENRPLAITGSVSDITARKQAEDRLAFLAFHDRLTGLPNRLGLLEELDARVDSELAATGLLLYCDLDRFHLINDIHGHDSGNNLLVETARRLEDTLPDDTTLSRIGADEFVAFIPVDDGDCDASEPGDRKASTSFLEAMARDHCQKIMDAFQPPFSVRSQSAYISTTIGIGLLTPEIDDSRTLIQNAHRALAHAKENGPANFAFYAGELALRQQRRLSLQSRLHRALERDEFTLHYQPLIDLDSGDIIGAEALLRWTTEDGERISPGEFIPVAEDSGLIIDLGDWVIEQACRDLSHWLDDGLQLTVSLNLSPHQFFHLDIVERVQHAVEDAGISAGDLELELTESAMLVDPDETAQILGRLRRAGFSIAIDDFGTGYSSLERLKQLPVETLKIDRSFVSDLPDTSRDASIVRSVVTLSQNFEMEALAEGIETREQWTWLRTQGCPRGQGYFFSRPLPADDFRTLCTSPLPWLNTSETASQS